MDDNGTYLGNIYGIYKACITNISIDIYDMKYKIITHTDPMGRPPKAAPVCLMDIFTIFLVIS